MFNVTYAEVGATAGELPAGYHHVRAERIVGHGAAEFAQACDDLFAGRVQERAGVSVRLSEIP